MTASHLPPRDGQEPSPASTVVAGASGPDVASDPHPLAHPSRAERLLALTEPGPLNVRWWPVVIASLVIAGILTLALGGAPTYDPWAWIIWGREIVEGNLDTTSGPSWKPLPMFFTVPFALFGDAAPDLWMWVARASALVGIVAVADVAARLGGRLAAGLAGLAIGLAPLYYAYGIQGSSEGALVLVCCLAATSWIDGRRTHAFWWLVAAALLRPEAWPFVAVVGVERLLGRPGRIWWLSGAGVLVIASWLVPEKIGSGHFLRAATRAHDPNPDSAAFAKSPTLEVFGSMGNLMLWLPLIGVIVAVVLGVIAWRRNEADRQIPAPLLRFAGFLGLLSLVWVLIVAAMTEGGYAGNPRYLAAPLGLLVAVALGGLAWLIRDLARRGGASIGELLVMASLLLLVVVAALRLPARTSEIAWQRENRAQLTAMADDPAIKKQVLACRPIVAHPLMVPPIAWTFHIHMSEITSREPAAPYGTYIIGRNGGNRDVRPILPAEKPVEPIIRTGQVQVVRSCAP